MSEMSRPETDQGPLLEAIAGADDRPGLSAPVSRRSLHRRTIETDGFLRDDGLFDIEARLIDTKSFGFRDSSGRERAAGARMHDLCVRLTLDAEMLVHDIEVAMPASPFSLCTQAMPNFRALVGARVGSGWRKTVLARVPITDGCTHVREMLSVMATVAFQTITSLSLKRSDLAVSTRVKQPERPHFIDGCLAWDAGREVVARLYPQFKKGSS